MQTRFSRFTDLTNIAFNKITKIVRALLLVESRACMRVCKTWLCDIKIREL